MMGSGEASSRQYDQEYGWRSVVEPICALVFISYCDSSFRELAIRSLLSTHLRCLRSTQTEHITRLHGTLVIVQHKLLNFIVWH